MTKIFISYRREDTAHAAGRIYDRLATHFRSENVFIDVDTIPPGVDFRAHVADLVQQCDVLLALIGRHWLVDAQGRRRLDDSRDLVRIEIESALRRKILVIPLFVGGAKMPAAADLPEGLAELAYRNAIEVRHESFHQDLGRLIEVLGKQGKAEGRDDANSTRAAREEDQQGKQDPRPDAAAAAQQRPMLLAALAGRRKWLAAAATAVVLILLAAVVYSWRTVGRTPVESADGPRDAKAAPPEPRGGIAEKESLEAAIRSYRDVLARTGGKPLETDDAELWAQSNAAIAAAEKARQAERLEEAAQQYEIAQARLVEAVLPRMKFYAHVAGQLAAKLAYDFAAPSESGGRQNPQESGVRVQSDLDELGRALAELGMDVAGYREAWSTPKLSPQRARSLAQTELLPQIEAAWGTEVSASAAVGYDVFNLYKEFGTYKEVGPTRLRNTATHACEAARDAAYPEVLIEPLVAMRSTIADPMTGELAFKCLMSLRKFEGKLRIDILR